MTPIVVAEVNEALLLCDGWHRTLTELLLGELTYTQNGGSGEIRAAAGGTECKGRWQYLSGKYGTAGPPKGIWSIACAMARPRVERTRARNQELESVWVLMRKATGS